MPFKSQAQQKWMFANHPTMARHWAHETPSIDALPKRAKGYRSTVKNPGRKVAKSYAAR